jgi:hypothetical protein
LVKHPYTLSGVNAVVKFEDVRVNRGQGYNQSIGVFTAPRKGLYHISCLILGYISHVVHYQLNKNDAVYTYGYATKGKHSSSTISSLMELKKGVGFVPNVVCNCELSIPDFFKDVLFLQKISRKR